MRKIKFRGFTVNEEKFNNGKDGWIYGNLSVLDDGTVDIQDINDNNWFKAVNPESVGQYTGLKDKNGKEIYEGDIIYCKQYIGGNCVEYCIEKGYVCFNDGEFGLYRKQGYYQSLYKFKEYDYEFAIIGNIIDNKDLLEEE